MPFDINPSDVPDTEVQSWVQKLGPGLITGAADDVPSGIATYSQAGAQFGFNMLWTIVVTYPLMVAIQVISARLGRVSGHGLATNIRRHYPAWLLYGSVLLLLVANTINIAADLTAMGAAVNLVVGGPTRLYTIALGSISVLLQVFVPYRSYVHVLKWLTLALFAYVATIFVVAIPWQTVVLRTVLPHLSWKSDYVTTVVAILGTTISPYLSSGRLRRKSRRCARRRGSTRSRMRRARGRRASGGFAWTPGSAWAFRTSSRSSSS